MKKLEILGTAGQLIVASTEIYSKRMVVVQKDGIGFSKIVFAGTPINKEVKYSSGGGIGSITFPNPLVQGEPVLVLYEDAVQGCMVPVIQSGIVLPDGIINQPYNTSFAVSGTQPFTSGGEVLPAGLSVSISNGFITISGTPTSTGVQPVSFTINNACDSYVFSNSINITDAPPSGNIDWAYSNDVGTGGRIRIIVNGITIINRTTSGNGIITAAIGVSVSIIVSSTVAGLADIDISGPYINSTSQTHVNTDGFTVVTGQYIITGGSS